MQGLSSLSVGTSFLGSGLFASVSNGGQMNLPGLSVNSSPEADGSSGFHVGSRLVFF